MGKISDVETVWFDGDVLVYRTLYSATETIKAGDWGSTEDEDEKFFSPSAAYEHCDELIADWLEPFDKDVEVRMVISHGDNFRKVINPSYKAHRPDEKPKGWAEVRAYLVDEHNAISKAYLEADDIIGIEVSKDPKSACVSIDKDFHTIPGWYHWIRINEEDQKPPQFNKVYDCDRYWFAQAIMGDPVDGYKGAKRKGEKWVENNLREFDSGFSLEHYLEYLWETCLDAFLSSGQTEEDAIMNLRMARILRDADYDAGTEQVSLWTPNHISRKEIFDCSTGTLVHSE